MDVKWLNCFINIYLKNQVMQLGVVQENNCRETVWYCFQPVFVRVSMNIWYATVTGMLLLHVSIAQLYTA